MTNFIRKFFNDDHGAIAVEWVVLTAGVVGLAVAAYSTVESESQQLANNVGATIQAWDTTAAAGGAGVAGE